jgi:hypothetical protein
VGMMKKQSVVAFVLLLLILPVTALGGMLFSLINPEMAAGHPNYVRNFHLLSSLKIVCFWGSGAVAAVLWLLVCLLVIRSKNRSVLWLFLAALGPVGLAGIATLKDRAPLERDRYSRFAGSLSGLMRGGYELCTFLILCVLAYQTMVVQRMLMIRYEAVTTGVSTAQIMNIQSASSGMWAFGEWLEVMYLVVLFYLLRPIVFCIVGDVAAAMATPKAH